MPRTNPNRPLEFLWRDWVKWADKRLYERSESTQASAELKKLYRATGLVIAALGGPQGFSLHIRQMMDNPKVTAETKARLLGVVLSLGILSEREIEKRAREALGDYDDEDLVEAKQREADQLRGKSSTPPRAVLKLRERLADDVWD